MTYNLTKHKQDGYRRWREGTYPLMMGRQWEDDMKWSGQFHQWKENNNIQAEVGRRMQNSQIDFKEGREQPRTNWGWADNVKWSDRLHEEKESNHIQTEDGQAAGNGQIDFKEGRRATTYKLRMERRREMVRSTSWRDREQPRTGWRWADDGNSGRLDRGKESNHVHTEDGQMKGNGQILHRGTESNHVQAEDGQTTGNGQVDLTDGRRATTYILRMGRRREMVRSTSGRDREQPRTGWGLVDDAKWSERLQGGIESKHVHAEDGQMTRNGKNDFAEGWKTITHFLGVGRKFQSLMLIFCKRWEWLLTS